MEVSGASRRLEAGEYCAQLLAYNDRMWEPDGSDYVHTWADPVYFTVAHASAAIDSGTCGDALTGVYVAEGNPALYDVDGVLYGYMDENPETGNGKVLSLIKIPAKKAITDYTVAKDVLCVGSSAFVGCTVLKNVTIHKDCEVFAETFDNSGVQAIWFEDGHPEFRSDSEGVVFNQDMTLSDYDFDLHDWGDTLLPRRNGTHVLPQGPHRLL